jgi:hypothetical protein
MTASSQAADTAMKILADVKSRWFAPALAALAVLGTAAGYAAHVYAADDNCCVKGAACCKPGAACCKGHDHGSAP